MDPYFFATPADFRSWLEANHADTTELWVGFFKKGTGRPSITWPEAVDEALCFGWIDGIRRRLDDERYTNRFTPRRPGSTWSAINTDRVAALTAEGRMRPAGLAAFARRLDAKSGVYTYEQTRAATLSETDEARFRTDPAAWAYFTAQSPSYRKAAIWWVLSAKREETRQRRLETLIADSAAGRRIKPLTRPSRD